MESALRCTVIYEQNQAAWLAGKRRVLNEGGTASSKTWSILQLLIWIAQYSKSSLVISIVSESLPHLKRGAIRDFFRVLGESADNNPRYNKTEQTFRLGTSIIEFFGADEPDKVRGPRRHILFLNEANNIPWETARGLDIRTSKFTICDWNPVSEFWAHKEWVDDPGSAYVHSTYLDAIDVLPPEVVTNIESYKDRDPNWWSIYGLGKLGKVEGLVYPLFEQVDALPGESVDSSQIKEFGYQAYGDIFYGLDFGFSNDPTVLVKNVIVGGDLFSQELIYEAGMTNDQIAYRMAELGVRKRYGEIFADSAEPKSIEEIYQHGYNIFGVTKGPGSVEFGHQKIRQYRQFWTKDSLSCIKEQRNFRYIPDKNGKLTDKTTHVFSHGMDARRYGVIGKLEPRKQFMIG